MNFDEYLKNFDYDERIRMKINIKTMLSLYKKGDVQLIDIRFPEEVKAWKLEFAKNIPINELPQRLDELDKDKVIVTLCPHYDRASLARHYLTLNGYNCKYLVEGMLGLVDYLRGDKARDFSSSF